MQERLTEDIIIQEELQAPHTSIAMRFPPRAHFLQGREAPPPRPVSPMPLDRRPNAGVERAPH
jgi:hypothetical protein